MRLLIFELASFNLSLHRLRWAIISFDPHRQICLVSTLKPDLNLFQIYQKHFNDDHFVLWHDTPDALNSLEEIWNNEPNNRIYYLYQFRFVQLNGEQHQFSSITSICMIFLHQLWEIFLSRQRSKELIYQHRHCLQQTDFLFAEWLCILYNFQILLQFSGQPQFFRRKQSNIIDKKLFCLVLIPHLKQIKIAISVQIQLDYKVNCRLLAAVSKFKEYFKKKQMLTLNDCDILLVWRIQNTLLVSLTLLTSDIIQQIIFRAEKFMNKSIENEFIDAELERQEMSESTQYRLLDNAEIDKLYCSYNLMKDFSQQITEQEDYKLSQILENYAERPVQFIVLPKNVMHILDKRIQRMLKNKKLKKNWSNQDTEILYWTFCHYCRIKKISSVGDANKEDWKNISNLIPGSNPDSCMFKILDLKKIKLSDQKWTEQESNLLLEIGTLQHKKNWRQIAQLLYKKNNDPNKVFRNAKLCKQHWVCYLNPTLKKGAWSMEEDKLLLNLIILNKGNRKWAEIAKVFGGRTQNALKNRYTLIIQRLRRQNGGASDLQLIKEYFNTLNKRCAPQKLKKSQIKQFEDERKQLKQIRPNYIIEDKKAEELNQSKIQEKGAVNQALVCPSNEQLQITQMMLKSSENDRNFHFFNCIPAIYDYNQCVWIFPGYCPKTQ